MKNRITLIQGLASLVICLTGWTAQAQSLEGNLNDLNLSSNKAPEGVSSEKLYSVQTRYAPLSKRFEVGMGAANSFIGEPFLNSQQVGLALRYHFDDKWSLNASANYVFNTFSASADRLTTTQNIVPDVAYARYRADLMLGYNVFYGKFRLGMDQVFYLDQYVAVGPGYVALNNNNSVAAVGDLGVALWMGKSAAFRFGVKDYYYHEERRLSADTSQNILGYVDFAFLFGGASNEI